MITMLISQEIVKEEYSQDFQNFINILRNSNSTYKETPIEKIGWLYNFSYFKKKGEITKDYYENLLNMSFEQRLEEEISKVKVSLSMSAGHFFLSDRVSTVSEKIKETVKYITIQKMINEQVQINNQDVINSIPIPKEDMIPTSLEDQLKQAIESEDYIEAARIRDEIKKEKGE